MRRAQRLVLAALALATLLPAPARTEEGVGTINRMNAIGLIDFSARPTFKVGDWVKYHMKATSGPAVVDDYTMTVLIAGEEHWWGEDCFWVETTTQSATTGQQVVASLMSYDVFRDSLAMPRMQFYVRKIIAALDEQGNPVEQLNKVSTRALTSGQPLGARVPMDIDTLGNETITVPAGTFDCRKVKMAEGKAKTGSAADSTDYTELRETRTDWTSPKVPITHLVREDLDHTMKRKAWKIGKSSEATPMQTIEDVQGSAQLVGWGSGLKSTFLPESKQHSLAERRGTPATGRKVPAAGAKRPG